MTSPQEFDIAVIGAGPAGSAAAIRSADLGAKTVLITRGAFGGMAANEGPIPVRTLAHAARLAREARQLSRYGIETGPLAFDYQRLVARAAEVVAEARRHSTLLEQVAKAGVVLFEQAGTARFEDPQTLQTEHGPTLRAARIIICTGGVSRPLGVPGDEMTVTAADAFGLTAVPKSLVVIGAGATGVQVASIFNAFGTAVSLCQAGPRIIPTEDDDVSAEVARAFREDGIAVYENFGHTAEIVRVPAGVKVVPRSESGAAVEGELAVHAIGWMADTARLNLRAAGVRIDSRGFIAVDEFLQTSAPNVYAAGDVIGRAMLVPQAVRDGFIAGSNAAMPKSNRIPSDVEPIGSFTDPEYAKVGLTEEQARTHHDVLASEASYAETTRPIIDGRTRGFCKIVVDRADRKLLGCHIVGERAVEVAQMATIAMTAGMQVDALAAIPLSFPTYGNVLGRAALRAVRQLKPLASNAYSV
jgi:pyruvate/2-oxoglutarate dehydrogenase complex dihydrolipoamide dehydrogenase (E3) component